MVEVRKLLLLSLGDLLVITRKFINADVCRSRLDRCLSRHGVSNLRELKPKPEAVLNKTFKDYEPGFAHIKYLPQTPSGAQVADEDHRQYLFVAIDRATRHVHAALKSSKSASSAKTFLKEVIAKAPCRIHTLLTDNNKTFTDRISVSGPRQPAGNHLFDQLYIEQAIDHRLIPIRRPRTNGMLERFNGRISEVIGHHAL